MPSEKMKYILRRAAKTAMRTDIALSPLKEEIESIFHPSNIDDDCDTIASLLYDSPDYTCADILKSIISEIKSGKVSVEKVTYLDGCMAKIAKMEAYEDYGSPFCFSDWERYKG